MLFPQQSIAYVYSVMLARLPVFFAGDMQRQNVIRNEHLLKLTVLYRLGVSDIAEAVGMLNENEIRVN